MKSSRLFDRRAGFSLASLGLLLGLVVPSVIPAFASASQLASRSIQLSNSAAGATGVSYQVSFTPSAAFQTVVIDFCSDSPVVGQTCTAPGGFDVSSETPTFNTGSIGTITTTGSTAAHAVLSGSSTASSAVTFTMAGVSNPTATGTFYARIYTYSGSSNYTNTTTPGAHVDDGGIALAATNSVGVTAAVRESMTFCVSGQAPNHDCGTGLTAPAAGSVTTPNLTLGTGSPAALDATLVNSGQVFAQISTNALSGAIVRMTNSNSCGGLKRLGATGCDIPAQTSTSGDLAIGTPGFGVKLGSASSASGASAPSGTLQPAGSSNYTTSNYFMNYDNTNATGVTSAYGDPILDTNGAPINNKNIGLTFGAAISNTTAAGLYSANINLIATGTF